MSRKLLTVLSAIIVALLSSCSAITITDTSTKAIESVNPATEATMQNKTEAETPAPTTEIPTTVAPTDPPTEPQIEPTTEPQTEPPTTAAPVSEEGCWLLTSYKSDSTTLQEYQIRSYEKENNTKAFIVFEKNGRGFLNLFGDEQEFTWEKGDFGGVKYTIEGDKMTAEMGEATLVFKKSNDPAPKRGEWVDKAVDPSKAQITEQVIYDDKGIKVTAKSIEYGGWYGPELKLLIENNSGKNLTFQVRNCSINGFMIDPMMSTDVANGKKANDTMTFSTNDFEKAGIEGIAEMQFQLHVFDSSSWDTYVDSDYITLKTDVFDTYTQTTPTSGKVLYDANGIKIVALQLSQTSYIGPGIDVYIENNSKQDITIQIRDCSVNGFMIDPFFSSDIATGKKIMDSITFSSSDLEKNGITTETIKDIELSFHIFNMKSWDTIVDTDTVTISFK